MEVKIRVNGQTVTIDSGAPCLMRGGVGDPGTDIGGDPDPVGDPGTEVGGDPDPVGDPGTEVGGDPEPVGDPGTDVGGGPDASGTVVIGPIVLPRGSPLSGAGGPVVIGPIVVTGAEAASGIADTPGTSGKLSFTMQPQAADEWCWAAVAVSVDDFFNPGLGHTQCKLAQAELNVETDDCCSNPFLPNCDKPWYLDRALRRLRRLKGRPTGPIRFAQVKRLIDHGKRPVALSIVWRGGNGHFVVFSGYLITKSGVRMVQVEDPFYGPSLVRFDAMRSAYLGSGSWTTTYPI